MAIEVNNTIIHHTQPHEEIKIEAQASSPPKAGAFPDSTMHRPITWATPEAGWKAESYKDLSVFGKMKYGVESIGTKIQALLNAIRQSFTPNGEASTEILKDDLGKINEIDNAALLKGSSAGPSATVKKLVDKEGARSARLSTGDLKHLIDSLSKADKINVIDGGYPPGNGFKLVTKRKPSDKLTNLDPNKTTLMPFAFPANKGSEEHVVLISVDPKTKEIRYFDPKGAHSDDPARLGGFTDEPGFNMRNDLEALKKNLTKSIGKGWTIMENSKAYQRDATNCGVYVALAMQDEAEGKPVGKDWQSGLTWVNAQKKGLAKNLWAHNLEM